jgi:hypothetical protein
VKVDRSGFVLMGAAAGKEANGFQPAALESNVPGVFAVGDVRSGWVKRARVIDARSGDFHEPALQQRLFLAGTVISTLRQEAAGRQVFGCESRVMR